MIESILFLQSLVQTSHFRDLLPYTKDGIQRGHGFLKNHADVPPPDFPHLLTGEAQQIATAENNRSGSNPAGRHGNKPHDGQGKGALSATGFAYDPKRFSLPDLQITSSTPDTPSIFQNTYDRFFNLPKKHPSFRLTAFLA
jgi:hypothetical protein